MASAVEKAQERVAKLRAEVAAEQRKLAVDAAKGEDAVVLAQLEVEETRLKRELAAFKDATSHTGRAQERAVERIKAQLPDEDADRPMNPAPDGAPVSVDPDAATYEEALKASTEDVADRVAQAKAAETETTPAVIPAATTSKGKD